MKQTGLWMLAVLQTAILTIAGCGSSGKSNSNAGSSSPAATASDSKAADQTETPAKEVKKLTLWFYYEGKSQNDSVDARPANRIERGLASAIRSRIPYRFCGGGFELNGCNEIAKKKTKMPFRFSAGFTLYRG